MHRRQLIQNYKERNACTHAYTSLIKQTEMPTYAIIRRNSACLRLQLVDAGLLAINLVIISKCTKQDGPLKIASSGSEH